MIKTKIKFFKSEKDGKTLVGYVTENESGAYRGCREKDPVKKKVVIPDAFLAQGMIENALYDCTIKPMKSGAGFIAVEASLCQFPAIVDATVTDTRFKVTVMFGNTTIIYDPQFGKDRTRNTVEGVLEVLQSRNDIRDKEKVIDAFLRSANMVCALHKDYKRHQL